MSYKKYIYFKQDFENFYFLFITNKINSSRVQEYSNIKFDLNHDETFYPSFFRCLRNPNKTQRYLNISDRKETQQSRNFFFLNVPIQLNETRIKQKTFSQRRTFSIISRCNKKCAQSSLSEHLGQFGGNIGFPYFVTLHQCGRCWLCDFSGVFCTLHFVDILRK